MKFAGAVDSKNIASINDGK